LDYRQVPPSPGLAPFVECFWHLSAEPAPAEPLEAILPDGCMELIVQLLAPMRRAGVEGAQPRVFVCGQLTAPLLLEPSGPVRTFGVRFRPGGARPFFEGNLGDLADRDTPLADLWGSLSGEMEDRLHAARGVRAMVAAAERLLLLRLSEGRRDGRVESAVRLAMGTRGRARLEGLAGAAALSHRQLERRFRAAVGLSPKKLSRIVRFQRLVRIARRPGPFAWAEAAARCGYFDQAHLIRDVREFSGAAPPGLREGARDFTAPFVSEERLAALFAGAFFQDAPPAAR
jgi:AraC-like DNA-binding protein